MFLESLSSTFLILIVIDRLVSGFSDFDSDFDFEFSVPICVSCTSWLKPTVTFWFFRGVAP